ncbi:sigma 54-interacting transcriptional regulator [Candidatus Formimonas warabiya]|uniref:Sigma-54 factor interaction domain-containing protein n=1 Tax=Formimonas warabiya TaxID=1761012 RepID=A0A3G1KXG4_FORW1|nr:sigma 54-interacting transcriptional regulator [Candidatus Formimonas warabiya]ATW27146.1 hypothetical protein DCMF_22495 [Candidatus Formimonas warabiya]
MGQILFIAPEEKTAQLAREISAGLHIPIHAMVMFGLEREKLLTTLSPDDTEVVVSRWGFDYRRLVELSRVPLIEIPLTAFDLIDSTYRAMQYAKPMGIIHSKWVIEKCMDLAAYLGLNNLVHFEISRLDLEEIKKGLLSLKKNGVKIVLGGITATNMANTLGLTGILIRAGRESIEQALTEAARLIPARKIERERAERWETILRSSHDGIIAVDTKGLVTLFNRKAEKIFSCQSSRVHGCHYRTVDPSLPFAQVLAGKKNYEAGELLWFDHKPYLTKIVSITVSGKTVGAVATILEAYELQNMEARLRKKLHSQGFVAKSTFENIIGESEAIQYTIACAKKYSRVESAVLIQGESGTGKEIFAQSIHRNSPRAKKPFVAINCAALPPSLLESELFGYSEGAFTGARRQGKQGVFELAHGGSIFLDEITEVPLDIQGRFLRVLQEKEVIRIGDDKVIPVDIRVIAATNKNLQSVGEQGKFRKDLFFRLNVLPLWIPPLRERKEDIPILFQFFLEKTAPKLGKVCPRVEKGVDALLCRYHWPGNVRQLENLVERALVLWDTKILTVKQIDQLLEWNMGYGDVEEVNDLKTFESDVIFKILDQYGGNRKMTAKHLGISTTTLWRRLKLKNIPK